MLNITHFQPIRLTSHDGLTFALATGVLCFLLACSSSPKTGDPTSKKALSGTDESIFLGDTIEKNYDPNVIMKRGEAFFEKEEFPEAIVEYNHFLDLHRNHMLASYAAFRIGESHMKRAKGIERDPEPIQKAIDSFERLRRDYPGSRYEGQAIEKLEECHDLLAQMHLFVGQFYYRRGSYLAAAHRFEQIMKIYPDKSVAPDALYFLAMSYHDLGADDWATEKLTLLAEKYPDSAHANEGAKLLAKIMKSQPSVLTAKKTETPATGSEPSPARQQAAPAGGVTPEVANGLMRLPSATAFGQGFVTCRLGAWC
ncbi:MAG TPA: outer membrane protein assembly factor BamD [Nitrospira sp.]|nr:outer membrane protein assembly factor BamD [Nitrospira sp.]